MKRVFSIRSVNPGTRALHTDERSNAERGVDRQAKEGIIYFPVGVFVWGYQMSLAVLRIILSGAWADHRQRAYTCLTIGRDGHTIWVK
jgi:hypothetical protein